MLKTAKGGHDENWHHAQHQLRVPAEPQVYFHRVGRTCRMGGDGTAIMLVNYGEISDFNDIKALTKTTIEELANLRPRLTHTKLLLKQDFGFLHSIFGLALYLIKYKKTISKLKSWVN